MTVIVGMSGGVDSSVAAYILKREGFYVEGATMRFMGVDEEDTEMAKKSCEVLGIKHKIFDFSKEYEKIVVNNFIDVYKSGKTPNPCVLCNENIKFGILLNKAKEIGFNLISTGHYARIEEKEGIFYLKKGKDNNEQSYFLYRLKQEQLKYIQFPNGNLTKDEIREIAEKTGLPTARRKKSQDVCFLHDLDYRDFLRRMIKEEKGPIVMDGKMIGEHKGITRFTYGQRTGLGISYKEPLYVIKISPEENTIYVGTRKDVYKSYAIIKDVNVVIPYDIEKNELLAKSRYKSEFVKVKCKIIGDRVEVYFEKPHFALTPGQSIVLYKDDYVVGGGIIDEVR